MQYKTNILLLLLLLAGIIYSTTAQTVSFGACKDIQGVDYMDYEKLQGVWYEYARSPRFEEDFSRCITFQMGLPIKGEKPTKTFMLNSFLSLDYQTSSEHNSSITGEGKVLTSDKYDATYLNNDYDEYVVVYACQNQFGMMSKQDVTWILTRERFPPCDVVLRAFDTIWEYGLSVDSLKRTNQTNCPDSWDDSPDFLSSLIKVRG